MENLAPLLTAVFLVVAFLAAVLLFLMPFFVFRIRNEVVRIRKAVEDKPESLFKRKLDEYGGKTPPKIKQSRSGPDRFADPIGRVGAKA